MDRTPYWTQKGEHPFSGHGALSVAANWTAWTGSDAATGEAEAKDQLIWYIDSAERARCLLGPFPMSRAGPGAEVAVPFSSSVKNVVRTVFVLNITGKQNWTVAPSFNEARGHEPISAYAEKRLQVLWPTALLDRRRGRRGHEPLQVGRGKLKIFRA